MLSICNKSKIDFKRYTVLFLADIQNEKSFRTKLEPDNVIFNYPPYKNN